MVVGACTQNGKIWAASEAYDAIRQTRLPALLRLLTLSSLFLITP